jgi:hypothetical protein
MKHRIFRVAAVLAVPLLCVFALAGCGGVDKEELLLQTATSDMDELVQMIKSEEYNDYLDSDAAAELESVGIDTKSFVDSLVNSFGCEVETVGVDGDEGTVTVEVTAVDAATVVEDWTADVTEWMTSEEGVDMIVNDREGAYAHIGQMLQEAFESPEAPTLTVEHELGYTWDESSKSWQLDMTDEEIAAFVTDSFGI